MKYIASFSGGKDSTAMVLRLMEKREPLTHVVFYNTGMEFRAIYRNVERIRRRAEAYGAQFTILEPRRPFLIDMMAKPVKDHYGYGWCGGACRWQTREKIGAIQQFKRNIGECTDYIGIALDEPKRIKPTPGIDYPLVRYRMTEADCLRYCYDNGFNWKEGETDLYQILDRVSCWCCANKNLKELRAMHDSLPEYWGMLKGLQSKIDIPFKHGATVFDLEKRFEKGNAP